MEKKYYDALCKVRTLSSPRDSWGEQEITLDGLDIDLEELAKEHKNDPLHQYLESLDTDTLKVIVAVMYIGRDFVIEPTEEYYRELENYDGEGPEPSWNPYPVANPDTIIAQYIKDIADDTVGENRFLLVDTIYEKGPLPRYLRDAFKKLGL